MLFCKMLLESFNYLNKELEATILMVTHESDMAKYAKTQIHFLDGNIESIIKNKASDQTKPKKGSK